MAAPAQAQRQRERRKENRTTTPTSKQGEQQEERSQVTSCKLQAAAFVCVAIACTLGDAIDETPVVIQSLTSSTYLSPCNPHWSVTSSISHPYFSHSISRHLHLALSLYCILIHSLHQIHSTLHCWNWRFEKFNRWLYVTLISQLESGHPISRLLSHSGTVECSTMTWTSEVFCRGSGRRRKKTIRNSKFPNSQISKFPNFRISKFPKL